MDVVMDSKILSARLLCLLGAALLLGACNSDSPQSNDRVSAQLQPEAINIGVLTSTVSRRDAALLAAQHINASGGIGGRDLNVIGLSTSNVDATVDKATELADENTIPIISVSTSSRILAVVDALKERNILFFSESATSPLLTDADDNGKLFRLAPSDVFQGRLLSELILESGVMNAAVVYEADDLYGSSLAAQFSQRFLQGDDNNRSLTEIVIPGNTDVGFDSFIQQIVESAPEAILVATVDSTVTVNFLNEISASDYTGNFLFPDASVSSDITSNVANLDRLHGSVGITPGFGLQSSSGFQFFQQQYLSQYNREPENFNANVYDVVVVSALAQAHARSVYGDSPSAAQLAQSLIDVANPPGVMRGPDDLSAAIQDIASGIDINYSGAYTNFDFDTNGDLVGELVYDVFLLDANSGGFVSDRQEVIAVAAE